MSKMPTIKNLQNEAWVIAEKQDFHSGLDPANRDGLMIRLGLIHTEVSEAFQIVKRKWIGPKTKPKTQARLAEQLADIQIHLLDLAEIAGVDLEAATLAKMKINVARPYRYGTPDKGKGEGT